MTQERRLRIALIVVGISFVAGLYPMVNLWQAGFRWQPEQPQYEQVIAVIYAVLGIFLVRASRDPFKHLSLIWFTVWSSLGHAVVMAVHAVVSDVAEAVVTLEERSRVRMALARLPHKQAVALVLRHSGLSYADVAAALDLSPGSIGTTVRRAESALRKELNRHASSD